VQSRFGKLGHGLPQGAMLFIEQGEIAAPCLLAQRLRRDKPVTSFQWKATSLFAEQPSPDRVLPVRSMNDMLCDIVPLGMGAPRCLCRAQSADRATQIGTMPRFLVIGLIEQRQ
jgi:hypothetical protein